tara:strand:- start:1167 stop:1397 length:231 start_codon:yes stop_codon:yes gene_type:complete
MEKQKILPRVKELLRNMPYGGIREISEKSGYPRSTVIDVLSTDRKGRRIDERVIYRATIDYLKERKINYEPLNQLI